MNVLLAIILIIYIQIYTQIYMQIYAYFYWVPRSSKKKYFSSLIASKNSERLTGTESC